MIWRKRGVPFHRVACCLLQGPGYVKGHSAKKSRLHITSSTDRRMRVVLYHHHTPIRTVTSAFKSAFDAGQHLIAKLNFVLLTRHGRAELTLGPLQQSQDTILTGSTGVPGTSLASTSGRIINRSDSPQKAASRMIRLS